MTRYQDLEGLRSGDPVRGQWCPRCRQTSVVYNGNYFCTECDWAMGDGNRPKRIMEAYLLQRYRQAKAVGDQEEVRRMRGFLREVRGTAKKRS